MQSGLLLVTCRPPQASALCWQSSGRVSYQLSPPSIAHIFCRNRAETQPDNTPATNLREGQTPGLKMNPGPGLVIIPNGQSSRQTLFPLQFDLQLFLPQPPCLLFSLTCPQLAASSKPPHPPQALRPNPPPPNPTDHLLPPDERILQDR